jgi:hypothetical protein
LQSFANVLPKDRRILLSTLLQFANAQVDLVQCRDEDY